MALIEIQNLTKHYISGDETVEALRGVDISIEKGEFITIMGQSGSGKSTLLSVLGGMNHPTAVKSRWPGSNSISCRGKAGRFPGAESWFCFPVVPSDFLSDCH